MSGRYSNLADKLQFESSSFLGLFSFSNLWIDLYLKLISSTSFSSERTTHEDYIIHHILLKMDLIHFV